jgi:hypothetical protein
MRNPICLLRTLYRTLKSGQFYTTGQWISGHEFETERCGEPANVHVIRCQTCGKYSVSWANDSLEAQK